MSQTLSIHEIDLVLDELDRLARSSVSRTEFADTLLSRVQALLNASSAGLFLRSGMEALLPVASVGEYDFEAVRKALTEVVEGKEFLSLPRVEVLAVPLARHDWTHGCLAVQFRQLPSVAEVAAVANLLSAFCEIWAIHVAQAPADAAQVESDSVLAARQAMLAVSEASSLVEGAYQIVNNLAVALRADRVSLVSGGRFFGAKCLAISGVVLDGKQPQAVKAIQQACRIAINNKESYAIYQNGPSVGPNASHELEQELLANRVVIPLAANADVAPDTALLVEWDAYENFLRGCDRLNQVLPNVRSAWMQLTRWLSIPAPVRWISRPRARQGWRGFTGGLLRWGFVGIMLAGCWLGLRYPVTLRIEAEGTLQPVERRAVHAPLDGIVSQILIADGERVVVGDPLIQLASPQLELQIQDVLGEMRANQEKRNGLSIAVNQLNNLQAEMAMQIRLSSEIRELDTRLESLKAQRDALLAEKEKLLVVAPIDGTLVARQIERLLQGRPVSRGEILLQIANLQGPWQLELLVADRDVGYVRDNYATVSKVESPAPADLAGEKTTEVRFVLAADPDRWRSAELTWMSDSARNANGEGMFVDSFAAVEDETRRDAHMGASAVAFFDCGKQPVWFVWSRPFVEFVQHRMWF